MKQTGMKWRQIFSDPAYITRARLLHRISLLVKSLEFNGGGVWLDVGCGSRPYEFLFDANKYIALDIVESGNPVGRKNCDVLYDGVMIPMANGSIDGVICTQVLEHAKHPESLVAEIMRVLRPGGSFIISAPFLWQEHEKPYDFHRFTSYGLISMLQRQGFQMKEYYKSTGSIEALAQMLSVFVITNLHVGLPGWGKALAFFLCAPIQIAGIIFQKILPDGNDLFLDSIVLAYKPENGE